MCGWIEEYGFGNYLCHYIAGNKKHLLAIVGVTHSPLRNVPLRLYDSLHCVVREAQGTTQVVITLLDNNPFTWCEWHTAGSSPLWHNEVDATFPIQACSIEWVLLGYEMFVVLDRVFPISGWIKNMVCSYKDVHAIITLYKCIGTSLPSTNNLTPDSSKSIQIYLCLACCLAIWKMGGCQR